MPSVYLVNNVKMIHVIFKLFKFFTLNNHLKKSRKEKFGYYYPLSKQKVIKSWIEKCIFKEFKVAGITKL